MDARATADLPAESGLAISISAAKSEKFRVIGIIHNEMAHNFHLTTEHRNGYPY